MTSKEKKSIVKIAAENVKFEATDDLTNDILRLAGALRERGLVNQADMLEDRMLVFKVAKEHIFDDLLDFAYPEGDVHISDAKEGWGQVLTPQNQAKKIRETVEKGNDIKTAAALIRIKTAQLEDPGIGFQDDGRIAAVKKKVDDAWESIRNAQRQVILDTRKLDFFKAPLDKDVNARNLYSKYSGVSPNSIIEYYAVLDLLTQPGITTSVQSIENRIRTDLNNVIKIAQRLKVRVDNYLNGVSGFAIPSGFQTHDFAVNPQSIYLEIPVLIGKNRIQPLNKQNIHKFAQDIYNAFIGLSETVFGKFVNKEYQKIIDANEKIRSIYNNFIEEIAKISVTGADQLTDRGEINFRVAISKLNGIRDNFIVIKNSENSKKLYEILSILDPDGFNKINMFWKDLGNVINQAERSMAVGNMTSIVSGSDVKRIGNDLRAGAAFWANFASSLKPGSEDRKNANENADRLSSLAVLVESYADKQLVNLFAALDRWASERNLPEIDFSNINEFKNFVATLLERPKTSSRNDSLIKIAQANPWLKPIGKSPNKPAQPSQPAPKSNQTSAPSKQPSAVEEMQKQLYDFGKNLETSADKLVKKFPELDINKLLEDAKQLQNTGNQNTPFDGQWGPKTDAALKIFNEYAAKFDSTIAEIAENIRRSDIFQKAKENINSIVGLIKKIDFAGIISGVKDSIKQYDSVFRGLMSGSWAADNVGDIPVRPADFESLPSFYMFLQQFRVEPGIKIAKPAARFEKYAQENKQQVLFKATKTVDDFDSSLNWFLQRAYVLYWTEKRKPDGERDDDKVKVYEKYFNDVKALQNEWNNVRDNFKGKHVTLGGLMNVIETPQAQTISHTPQRTNSDGTDVIFTTEDENITALNKRPFSGNMLDIIRLSKKYNTRYRNWFSKHLQHGVMNLESFDGGHPPELWASYRKPDDSSNPAKFFKMFLLLAQKDIAEAFSKWVKRVYNLPAQEANKAITEQQERMQEWMSVLSELVARTERVIKTRS